MNEAILTLSYTTIPDVKVNEDFRSGQLNTPQYLRRGRLPTKKFGEITSLRSKSQNINLLLTS